MHSMYYIGLDVHKRTISYCVKDGSGKVHADGTIPATRFDLDRWMRTLPQPWTAAMEVTVLTGWIYDHLVPHAAALVAHRLMLRAIAAAKRKTILSSARGLPGLAVNATERRSNKLRMLPLISFESGRRTQTQSSGSPEKLRKGKSGSKLMGTTAEANTRGEGSEEILRALLRSASGELLPS
jgi:hypothetical protein